MSDASNNTFCHACYHKRAADTCPIDDCITGEAILTAAYSPLAIWILARLYGNWKAVRNADAYQRFKVQHTLRVHLIELIASSNSCWASSCHAC